MASKRPTRSSRTPAKRKSAGTRKNARGATKRPAPSATKAAKPRKRARAPSKRTAPTPEARELARRIAERIPFVHFPARTRFATFLTWERLESRKDRKEAPPTGDFEQLRWGHVFAYAGPCCYYSQNSIGDAVAYFQPALDADQLGALVPFDSGSLEEPTPKLQPWAKNSSLEERWQFLQQSQVPLTNWRAEFEQWLLYCYAAPDRYLDSSADRYTAGTPDRTRPPALLEHNGDRGRTTYGEGECADRRAWIWEAHFEKPVPFVRLQVLHLARDRVQEALNQMSKLRFASQVSIALKTLPPGQDASADTLYEDSGRVLRELIGI